MTQENKISCPAFRRTNTCPLCTLPGSRPGRYRKCFLMLWADEGNSQRNTQPPRAWERRGKEGEGG